MTACRLILPQRRWAIRQWQKYINVKSVSLETYLNGCYEYKNIPKILLKLILTLKNVEKIDGEINLNLSHIVQAIMCNCCHKIKYYDLRILSCERGLSPLKLLNAEYIGLHTNYFNIIWSNKCKHLEIAMYYVPNVESWFNFICDNCDCSGVTYLQIYSHGFEDSRLFDENTDNYQAVLDKTKHAIKQFASKFSNIQKLKMKYRRIKSTVLELVWKEFEPLICKNNVFAELEIDVWLYKDNIDSLSQMAITNNLTLSKKILSLCDDNEKATTKLIKHCSQSVQWLKVIMLCYQASGETLTSFIDFLSSRSSHSNNISDNDSDCGNGNWLRFASLKILELSAYERMEISTINDLIKLYAVLSSSSINDSNENGKILTMGDFTACKRLHTL